MASQLLPPMPRPSLQLQERSRGCMISVAAPLSCSTSRPMMEVFLMRLLIVVPQQVRMVVLPLALRCVLPVVGSMMSFFRIWPFSPLRQGPTG